ncbi:MAG: catalase-related domain-containing protein, partial [Acidimicrobiales bacterium]
YTRHRDDDDFVQPGSLYREVLGDSERARLVANIAAHLRAGVGPDVLTRALEYWRKVDGDLGARVAKEVTS